MSLTKGLIHRISLGTLIGSIVLGGIYMISHKKIMSNETPVINATDKIINQDDRFNELQDITATDKEDGDLTSKIKVIENNIDTSKAGKYNVIYSVSDNDSNKTTKAINVIVKGKKIIPNENPVINATNKIINQGSVFYELHDVSAKDKENDILTLNINIVDNNVDTSKAGTYHVTYSVTGKDGNKTVKTIKVIVKGKIENENPVINATDKTINQNDVFNELQDITAEDKEDGDLTSKINVVDNNVDISKVGIYYVTYNVTDNNGNKTVKTIKVTVKNEIKETPTIEDEKPIISANDKTINQHDVFNELKDVCATDKEDGDLTSKIKIIENNVDTSKVGTYNITYSVIDSNINKVTKSIKVIVNKKIMPNEKPIITATDKSINQGDIFNKLQNITATDKEDGNLTSKIKVIKSNVDTSEVGTYNVTYSVTDSNKDTTTKTIKVTVNKISTTDTDTTQADTEIIETMENEKPIINIEDLKIKVGQSFNPLDGVSATDKEDGDLTSKTEVIANNVDINTVGDYKIGYKVVDSDGNGVLEIRNVSVIKTVENKNNEEKNKENNENKENEEKKQEEKTVDEKSEVNNDKENKVVSLKKENKGKTKNSLINDLNYLSLMTYILIIVLIIYIVIIYVIRKNTLKKYNRNKKHNRNKK